MTLYMYMYGSPHIHNDLVTSNRLLGGSSLRVTVSANDETSSSSSSQRRLEVAARALNRAQREYVPHQELLAQFEYELAEALAPPPEDSTHVLEMLQRQQQRNTQNQTSSSVLQQSTSNSPTGTSLVNQILTMASTADAHNNVELIEEEDPQKLPPPTNFAGIINQVRASRSLAR